MVDLGVDHGTCRGSSQKPGRFAGSVDGRKSRGPFPTNQTERCQVPCIVGDRKLALALGKEVLKMSSFPICVLFLRVFFLGRGCKPALFWGPIPVLTRPFEARSAVNMWRYGSVRTPEEALGYYKAHLHANHAGFGRTPPKKKNEKKEPPF